VRTLSITAPGVAEIVERPTPEPAPGEALVRIEAVTTCPQWDLHLMNGTSMFPGRELVYPYMEGQPGHEATGNVAAVGAGVRSLAVGDRVCTYRDGGHQRPGCYAEYVSRPAEEFLKAPQDLPAAALAPLELAMCLRVSFESLERLDAVRDARFGVSGLGPAGIVAIQMARAGGVREVIGYDLDVGRREFAVNVGADAAFDPREVAGLDDRHSGDALDASIECVGAAAATQFLMDRTRKAVALFGVLREEATFGWRHWSGLALLGYPFGDDGRPAHSRAAGEAALALVKSGELDLAVLVGETLPLAEYTRGIDLLRAQQKLKVCFVP